MVMAAIAWSVKARCALLLPVSLYCAKAHEEQRRRVRTLEFKTFLRALVEIPRQIVLGARQVRWRVLAWNPLAPGVFFRLLDAL